jgi:ABC-2 type transport system permease protein
MRIIDLALKDLRQVARDRQSLIFMLLLPMVMTVFFGFMFRNQNAQADSRLVVGVVNHDPEGALGLALIDLLDRSDTVRIELISDSSAGELDSRIVKEELAAGLVIPAGFSAATLGGGSPQMEMVINEETPAGQTTRRALQTAVTRALGMAQAARSSLAAYEDQAGSLEASARADYLDEAVSRAAQAWQAAPLSVRVSSKVAEDQSAQANPYNQYSPGMMVMFALFGVMQAAIVLVIERRTGAMARMLTTPLTKPELIGGHILGMFTIFFLQQFLLVLFGQLILKVDYFRAPLAVLLVMAVLALWVASLGLLISALVKKEEQVVLFSMIGMFLFSALVGAWFSLEMVGGAFYTIGHLTPAAWAIDGFQNLVMRGLDLKAVLLPAGVVLAYAAAFFGIAIWRFRYE